MKKEKYIWILCVAAVITIVLITYTPLIIPAGQSEPFFMSLPYTLWITILLTIVLVVLTYLGGKVIEHEKEND
jgi:hypothetical protein